MTAPALVLLARGGKDRAAAQVSHQIRTTVLALRPELDVHVAFLDGEPSGHQVAGQLTKRRGTEAVVVPLVVSDAFNADDEVAALIAQMGSSHPQLRVILSRPVGPEMKLLSVVDRRLRDALRVRRVSELDGLVFAAAGSTDLRSNALIARRARQWSTHHRLPCVTAYATGSGPSTAEAIRTLRSQGRRHVAVGSWFLGPSLAYARQAELAHGAGAVAVSAPLGNAPEVAETALTRYLVAAIDLVDLESAAIDEPAPVRHLSVVGA